ncbi:MAG TPA: efflux RND transporter periplasmic adaptor subunit [Verrucomicrobiae bacterium]|nr:efflux RND transporter periplasmic adaptor subunit [Verrucomicrobiae bacterium]
MTKSNQLQNNRQSDQYTIARDDSPAGQPKNAVPMSSRRKRMLVGALALVFVLGILWVIYRNHAASSKRAALAHAGPPPVPVVSGRVVRKDVPIYLDGLGTVQALNTVTVHVQVDGQLQKIAFVEGQDVHVGDLLAQIDPQPFQAQLAQAEARKAQDEAQLAEARLDERRDSEELAAKIIAQQVYDQQKALANQLAATVKADQAAIDIAKVQLAYTTIVSPIDGRTGIRFVDQGNIVHVTDPNGLVVITQLRPVSVVFTLPEQTLGEIQEQHASGAIAVLAVGRDNSTVLDEGQLAVIDNQIDTTTGTIRLKATFPNADLRLWPGQFVNARLLLTTRKGGLVVPASVVQRGPEGPYAFVIGPNLTAEVRPVKVAQIAQGQALIDEGLRAGESVVVDGQYRLQDGSRVKINSSGKAGDSEP